jgi:acyl-CoA synthetase (AMP-forming)/AMP-acid ligase II
VRYVSAEILPPYYSQIYEVVQCCMLSGYLCLFQILFDGRIRFMGYAGDEARTQEMFDDHGRLRSGDLGHFDSKGRLFVTGRIKAS